MSIARHGSRFRQQSSYYNSITNKIQGNGGSLNESLRLSKALTDLAPIKISNLNSEDEGVEYFMSASPRGFFHIVLGSGKCV